jgi:hypothetical protein
MVRLLRLMVLWVLVACVAPLAGYGSKTYVPGLALIARRLYNYINKHIVILQANLDSDTYACITGLLACLQKILAYLNKEAP